MSGDTKKRLYTHLYFQALTGIAIGVLLGYFWPSTGAAMRPFGDGFIWLIVPGTSSLDVG